MYSSDELFQRSREGYFGVYFPSCEATREINTKNYTRVSIKTIRHESTYIILFLTRHTELINDDINDDLYTSSRVSLARFSFCWWRHNRLLMTSQWPDNCDAITWIVTPYSLDIDFIHGDIHGRSRVRNFEHIWHAWFRKKYLCHYAGNYCS